MLILDGKTDLNQISLTGIRSLALIGLLAIKPRSLDEIREEFLKMKIIDESHSNDILRIDLNTIKIMGCEISRSSAKTNYKYVLTKHPFTLKISEDDVKILKRVMDKVKMAADLSLLIEYHDLLMKITTYIYEDDVKEAIIGVSPLKYFNVEQIRELMFDCDNKNFLNIIYKKPTSIYDVKKKIIAQKLVYKNEKLYLYAYDEQKKRSVMLNFLGIKQILSRRFSETDIQNKQVEVKFILKEDFGVNILTESESILEETSEGYFIKGEYFNKFLAIQRILSFGSKCVVVEPQNIRNLVISKLKEMREVYEE